VRLRLGCFKLGMKIYHSSHSPGVPGGLDALEASHIQSRHVICAAERMTWKLALAGSRTGHRAGAFSSRSEHVHHVAPRGTHFADMFHQQNSRTAEQPPHLHVAPVLGRPSCGLLPHGRLPRHSSAAAGSLPGRSGFLLCPTDQGGPE